MNNLSWMLYLASVVASFGVFLLLVGVITTIVFGAGTIAGLIQREDNKRYGENDEDYKKGSELFEWSYRRLWIPALFMALACLMPSKETMYAIAVSQVGEQVLKTPEVGKARQALNAWLDKQVTTAEKKTDSGS